MKEKKQHKEWKSIKSLIYFHLRHTFLWPPTPSSHKNLRWQCGNLRISALHVLNPVFKQISFSDKLVGLLKAVDYKSPAIVQSMYIFKVRNQTKWWRAYYCNAWSQYCESPVIAPMGAVKIVVTGFFFGGGGLFQYGLGINGPVEH